MLVPGSYMLMSVAAVCRARSPVGGKLVVNSLQRRTTNWQFIMRRRYSTNSGETFAARRESANTQAGGRGTYADKDLANKHMGTGNGGASGGPNGGRQFTESPQGSNWSFRRLWRRFKFKARAIKVAGWSVGALGISLFAPFLLWPGFDQWFLPWAMKASIKTKKFQDVDFTEEGVPPIPCNPVVVDNLCRQLADFKRAPENSRAILLLVGSEASNFGRHFAARQDLCGHYDLRRVVDQNPYEIVCFSHMERLGKFYNTYMKGVVYLSSLFSKRHPHIETLMYTESVHNNYMIALQRIRKETNRRPFVIFDNVDSLNSATELSAGDDTKTLFAFLEFSVAEMSLAWGRDGRLAHIIWTTNLLTGAEFLTKPSLKNARGHLVVIDVGLDSNGDFTLSFPVGA